MSLYHHFTHLSIILRKKNKIYNFISNVHQSTLLKRENAKVKNGKWKVEN